MDSLTRLSKFQVNKPVVHGFYHKMRINIFSPFISCLYKLKYGRTLMLSLLILSTACDTEKEDEEVQNQPPVITGLTSDQQNIIWNSCCQLTVTANDPEGKVLSYSWISSGGEFTTPTNSNIVTWKCPMTSGGYSCTVTVSDGTHTVSQDLIINVTDPPFYFKDNFSSGLNNWIFGGCNYAILSGELVLVSTDYIAQARAQTNNFSPYVPIPWSMSGEIAITNSTLKKTNNGISVHINDLGSIAIEHMWLSVRNYYNYSNWAWLFWIPALENKWLPWDNDCYGTSNNIYTDGQVNSLEMSVNANKQFTLLANGHTLPANKNAILEFQNISGATVILDVKYVKVRGGNETTTRWDNILFYSTCEQKSEIASMSTPSAPSEEDLDEIFRQVEEGNVVTLKSLLLKKIENQ